MCASIYISGRQGASLPSILSLSLVFLSTAFGIDYSRSATSVLLGFRMHYCYFFVALAALQATAHTTILPNLTFGFSGPTVGYSAGKKAQCVSGNIGVSISATTTKLLLQEPANQTIVTEIVQELFQINSRIAADDNGGSTKTEGSFEIDVTLCLPTNAGKAQTVKTVEILTHGTGFDKSYWDIAPGYSYVDAAANAGYATLAYNRLGVGNSDHPDAIQVVQCTTDVEILHGIIQLLRSGRLASTSFTNVIGVGHSYGSIVQLANNGKYPKDTDAAVLTGFTTQLQYLAYAALANNPVIAAQHDPSRFGRLSNGYLTNNAPVSYQLPFFRYPYFDQSSKELSAHISNFSSHVD